MLRRFKPWLLVLFSLAYGVMLLSLDDVSGLYSLSPYPRQQASALLRGHLYLSDSIRSLQSGLAWHDGKVQQVWGLGVAFWLMPFQALWHLFARTDFPDRIALGIACALLAFYAVRTGIKISGQGRRAFAVGFVWLVLLCPGLWTLSRASQLVFEQTILYAVVLSLAILVSVVHVVLFGSKWDHVLCCALGALAIWVRPTHAIYGLLAVLASSFVLWKRDRSVRGMLLANAFWLLSAVLLAWTNWVRFGSPTEFGHHLTVSTGNMVYLTRFGNPFKAANPMAATEELVGMLFFNPDVHGANAFGERLFPWQSSAVRWRRMDLTSFDPIWAVICLVAIGGGILWFIRNRRSVSALPAHNLTPAALLIWGVISAMFIGVFYLYYPAMASRYQFDFAPAFTALAVFTWYFISSRWSRFVWPLLAIWLLGEVVVARVPAQLSVSTHQIRTEPSSDLTPIVSFSGTYTPSNHPAGTGIARNGYGWEPETGFASDVVMFAVDNPQFLELTVSDRRAVYGQAARQDSYRAQIDGEWLPLRDVGPLGNQGEKKVTFEVPEKIRGRHQTEIVFLCFSSGYDGEDRISERFLYSVRWR